jgi:hypothetical protein
MKWPWNASQTIAEPVEAPSESFLARLQRLEATVLDIDGDVEILLKTIPKINARLRQRARMEGEADGAEPEVTDIPRPVVTGAPTKDQMREIARAKGLIR